MMGRLCRTSVLCINASVSALHCCMVTRSWPKAREASLEIQLTRLVAQHLDTAATCPGDAGIASTLHD